MVTWEAFDWYALGLLLLSLSILTTGMLIANILYKAQRQQATIIKQQLLLEQSNLAHSLYDRRYRCYSATSALLTEAATNFLAKPSDNIGMSFLAAKTEAIFLYPATVQASMNEIWDVFMEMQTLQRQMGETRATTGEYRSGDQQKLLALGKWIDQRLMTLHEVFPQLAIGNGDMKIDHQN